MAYELIDIIDLSKLYEGIEPHYTWRIYINKDRRTNRYKVVVSGLSKKEYLNIYGTREEVRAKLISLIKHLGTTLSSL
jgi:5-bromo-4-chloroindolyl phosphate hydrolysis protein